MKRILQEAKELQNDPSHEYSAGPLENDIFEWHATLRGAPDTEFEGGLYHCRILLPSEYPFRPPSIMVLTPNGRFELNKKICISFTSYHEELWQPAWGVRTAIIGLQGFFPHKGESAVGVGALEYPIAERKRLAALSREWYCPDCQQTNLDCLPDPPAQSASGTDTDEVKAAENVEAEVVQPEASPENVIAPDIAVSEPATQPPANPAPTPTVSAHPATVSTVYSAPAPRPASGPTPTTPTFSTRPTPVSRPPARPPILLDLAIISLVSIFIAILARRVL